MMEGLWVDVWSRVSFVLPFLFVLTVVVFFHELGHFLVARWCGVAVKSFSIGFGREVAGFNDRHGTRWRLGWIPLGGYVKFVDDENAASVPARQEAGNPALPPGSFHGKPVWQRAAVVAAGPIANFLLAIVIFTGWYIAFGVFRTEPRIDEVVAGSPADKAGFKAGDLILAINGRDITGFEELQKTVSTSVGRPLEIRVEREAKPVDLTVIPELQEQVSSTGEKTSVVVIGIRRIPTAGAIQKYQPGYGEAVVMAVKQTGFIISATLGYVVDLFAGRQSADQLGGPARIADIAGKVTQETVFNILPFTALVSVGIGLFNLFPIPLLDGGHLLFYAVEAVRRRPLSERTQEIGFRIGLALIATLMIVATFNDLPIFKRWIVGAG